MSKIFSMCLYFISFAPLWLSVIFIDVKSIIENDQNLATEIISISMILIGMLVVCIWNRTDSASTKATIRDD